MILSDEFQAYPKNPHLSRWETPTAPPAALRLGGQFEPLKMKFKRLKFRFERVEVRFERRKIPEFTWGATAGSFSNKLPN